MARGRKRGPGGNPGAVNGSALDKLPLAESQPELKQLLIVAKRVTGDNKKRHLKGERIFVGEDVSRETAQLMVDNGLAVEIDGKLKSQIDAATGEAVANKQRTLQKQNAEAAMSRHDRMTPEERLEAQQEIITEEGDDIDG